jgi:hypothetical protein
MLSLGCLNPPPLTYSSETYTWPVPDRDMKEQDAPGDFTPSLDCLAALTRLTRLDLTADQNYRNERSEFPGKTR